LWKSHQLALPTSGIKLISILPVCATQLFLFQFPSLELTDIAVFNFFFLPFIYFFYPETQNLTLEQIDRLFTNEKVQLHWDSSMGIAGDVDTRVGNATAKDLESVNAQHIE
jgi:hypothetical protein